MYRFWYIPAKSTSCYSLYYANLVNLLHFPSFTFSVTLGSPAYSTPLPFRCEHIGYGQILFFPGCHAPRSFYGEEYIHICKHFQQPTLSDAHKLVITKFNAQLLGYILSLAHKVHTINGKRTHFPTFPHERISHTQPLSQKSN